VDPRAGLDDVEKRKFLTLPGLELQPLSRPAHSQSLYRLRYPGSLKILLLYINILKINIFTFQSLALPSYICTLRLRNAEQIRQYITFKPSDNKLGRTPACVKTCNGQDTMSAT
jgi:hypothetical protein